MPELDTKCNENVWWDFWLFVMYDIYSYFEVSESW
jgi:hypothetical protein